MQSGRFDRRLTCRVTNKFRKLIGQPQPDCRFIFYNRRPTNLARTLADLSGYPRYGYPPPDLAAWEKKPAYDLYYYPGLELHNHEGLRSEVCDGRVQCTRR